jgi:hypothetical protein
MRKKTYTLILLLVLSINLFAHSDDFEKCYKNPMFGYFYKQQSYAIENDKEDIILKNLVRGNAKSLVDHFKRNKNLSPAKEKQLAEIKILCPSFSAVYFNKKEYLNEEQVEQLHLCRSKLAQDRITNLKCKTDKAIRKSFIKKKKLSKDLKEVITKYKSENSSTVFLSRPHQWSKNTPMPVRNINTKLLTALALGVTNRFMMTPTDNLLRDWIKEQPFSSITPKNLFKKALSLSNGDVYLALLSIENILSEFWKDKKREQLRATASLSSITNFCPGEKPEDVFGSWYHLFGVMLLGCVEGGVKANIVGRIEALGGRVLDMRSIKRKKLIHLLIGSDPQEEKINRYGGIIGSNICKDLPKNF